MSSVTYSSDGTVGIIRISRPERRNALNHAALDLLHESVRSAADDELRCLVLTGDSGHFCAGADLTELEDLAFTDDLRAALDALGALPFPTIAAIAGSCMGLGMQLALACDLRIATADARFAVPVAKLGAEWPPAPYLTDLAAFVERCLVRKLTCGANDVPEPACRRQIRTVEASGCMRRRSRQVSLPKGALPFRSRERR